MLREITNSTFPVKTSLTSGIKLSAGNKQVADSPAFWSLRGRRLAGASVNGLSYVVADVLVNGSSDLERKIKKSESRHVEDDHSTTERAENLSEWKMCSYMDQGRPLEQIMVIGKEDRFKISL